MFNFGRRSESIRLGLLLPLAVATGVMTSAVSRVASLLVCPQGCPFSSIQAAIDAAAPGDTILVAPGRYDEVLMINKRLTLQGAAPDFVERIKELWSTNNPQEIIALREREEVAIYGPGSIPGPVISVQETTVTISGFTIGKVYAHAEELSDDDYGVLVQPGAQAIIENSILVGGMGSILVNSAMISLSNAIVASNSLGIEVHGASQATITDSWIENIGAAALTFDGFSQVLLLRSRIANNWVWCIIVGDSAQVQIQDNEILGNGIGIEIYGEKAQVQILNNQFSGNIEGVRVEYGQAIIQSNRFEGQKERGIWVSSQARLIENIVSKNEGDGIRISCDAQVEVVRNEIVDNGGCGIVISGPSCSGHPFPFAGSIVGRENEVHNNAKGDLCPPDYPWPPGFVKGP
jgi:parallel beta-helix repeat protein